ncbi:hypothetical protein [Terriglobus sp.]|uniref:hypothetical protein n=1 Tax=Terriglobus sp. TaxID=1889013 RepID=UPI003AFF6146
MAYAGAIVAEPTRPKKQTHIATRTKVYLFLLVFSLPIDFFHPTAMLLREAGAKPAIPLMAAGSAWIFWRHWPELFFSCPKLWRTVLLLCLAIVFLGTFAFVVNVGLDISYWGGLRNPTGQFASQGALFVLVAPVLIAHAWLFSRTEVQPVIFRLLPTVTLTHVLMILAEWSGLLKATAFPLILFRGIAEDDGRKPTGLMTEPSYVGAFAATYGLALLLCMPEKRLRDRVLGVSVMVLALVLGGKTLLPVLLIGVAAYAYQIRAKLFNWKSIAAFAGLALVAAYVILSYSVLDVQANLSSAMRIGSTMLALNAAAAGYGLLGIGFGQFHFIYNPEFAPGFLMYSIEAQSYFARIYDTRASTYNVAARYLIEVGILGLILFIAIIRLTFRNGRAHNDFWHRFGAVIAGSSLGFLLTQDTYFYPAFVCGAAILASKPPRN